MTYRKISPTNFKNLGNELYEFANADADNADNKALKQHYNFAKRVDRTVTELQEILEDCRRFLLEGNIALIQANKVKL